jgi:hypothetical protein
MEIAWGTIFVCVGVCSPINFADCWLLDWGEKTFQYCKYLHKPLMPLVGQKESWYAYKYT